MFERAELKRQAKEIIRNNFPAMLLVCLIISVLSGGLGLSVKFNLDAGVVDLGYFNVFHSTLAIFTSIYYAVFFAVTALIFHVFLINPLRAGAYRYFRRNSFNQAALGDLLYFFQNDYLRTVKTIFMKNLFVFLWSLLLLIPGIMKEYSYSFVPYLLSDYPELKPEELLEMSAQMTYGLRMDMFILDLSFILWNLLASFLNIALPGLGNAILSVYTSQTHAQLYQWVLENREQGI